MDIKKTKLGIAAGLLTLSFSMAAQSQAKELPFPSFPANFEKATYQGKKGCIASNSKYKFAVMTNEGLKNYGSHSMYSTPKEGTYVLDMVYNHVKGYGYILSRKGDGKICVSELISDLKKRITPSLLSNDSTIETKDCSFSAAVLNLCGTFKQLSERLTKAGYRYDWQAKNEEGNIITMLSGTGQSWILTTHAQTGATIFTGAGKGEFEFSAIKDKK